MSQQMSRALIVGATSSLAVILARKLAQQGVDLVLAGRNQEELRRLQQDLMVRSASNVDVVALDLVSKKADDDAFLQACGEFDAAFVLVGAMGEDNATTAKNIEQVVALNFTKVAILATKIAESMKMKGAGGTLAIISSVAGDRGRASNFVYGSAKAGLTAFVSGLRAKCFQEGNGVHLCTIKPGFIDTPMTFSMDSPLMASREKVADDIIAAVGKKKNTIYTPRIWWVIMTIIQHIPEVIFKRLKF